MSEEIPSLEHYIPGALEVTYIERSGCVTIVVCVMFVMRSDESYSEDILSSTDYEPGVVSASPAYYESWRSRMYKGGFSLNTSCIIFKPGATPQQG